MQFRVSAIGDQKKSGQRRESAQAVTHSANSTPSAGLCGDHSQKPGVRVLSGGHPGADAALPDVAPQPPVHRSDPRPAAVGAGRATQSDRDRRAQRIGPPALDAAASVSGRFHVVASGGLGSPERLTIRAKGSRLDHPFDPAAEAADRRSGSCVVGRG